MCVCVEQKKKTILFFFFFFFPKLTEEQLATTMGGVLHLDVVLLHYGSSGWLCGFPYEFDAQTETEGHLHCVSSLFSRFANRLCPHMKNADASVDHARNEESKLHLFFFFLFIYFIGKIYHFFFFLIETVRGNSVIAPHIKEGSTLFTLCTSQFERWRPGAQVIMSRFKHLFFFFWSE